MSLKIQKNKWEIVISKKTLLHQCCIFSICFKFILY